MSCDFLHCDRNRADRGGICSLAYLGRHDATSNSWPRNVTAPTGLDMRWKALASRDAAADGTFVYGVTSTGIYCRPSCPSRRPRADRVRFFDTTHRGAAGRISRLQALPPGHRRPRSAGHRCGSPRLGVSRDACRSDRDARSSGARRVDEPASPAAPLQGDRRAVAEGISVGGPRRQAAHEPARWPRCDDRDLRSRIRIAEPRL